MRKQIFIEELVDLFIMEPSHKESQDKEHDSGLLTHSDVHVEIGWHPGMFESEEVVHSQTTTSHPYY